MAKKLWGGRFSKRTDPLVEEFTKSVGYDYKLAEFDCLGSIYHVQVLRNAGLISAGEATRLKVGLNKILSSVKKGTFDIDKKSEDVHSAIQNALEKKIGKTALKLHTARSRNDQVVFDVKLYCIKNVMDTLQLSSKAIDEIFKKASKLKNLIIPGFTHLQHAEPLSLVYYLGAYMEMLKRDNRRLDGILDSIELTLGSGAVAGTNIKSSAYMINNLPFGKKIKAARNPVDTVSNRDFVLEILSTLAIMGMHLSRIAEDLIIWSTKEFGFVELDEAFCTGSSLMPQKKNPDTLELMRGYTGILGGNFIGVFTMMKGLPLSYNRDMQLDKEPLFNSFEIMQDALRLLAKIMASLKFNKENVKKQLEDESLYATGLSHYLVKKGIAFKDAHAIVGRLVKYSLEKNKNIKAMNNKELSGFSKFLDKDVIEKHFNPIFSVRTKRSIRN
ncbi:MAG: argininosuccinate lyase [Candidatus Omnitrophica bacterium]|nr:argininosuccinate lyase [Candidatus Omnitrophota bacterium]